MTERVLETDMISYYETNCANRDKIDHYEGNFTISPLEGLYLNVISMFEMPSSKDSVFFI